MVFPLLLKQVSEANGTYKTDKNSIEYVPLQITQFHSVGCIFPQSQL